MAVTNKKRGRVRPAVVLTSVSIVLLLFFSVENMDASRKDMPSSKTPFQQVFWREFWMNMSEAMYRSYLPLFSFEKKVSLVGSMMDDMVPFYDYMESRDESQETESPRQISLEELMNTENTKMEGETDPSVFPEENRAAFPVEETVENTESVPYESSEIENVTEEFLPHERVAQVDINELRDYETLVKKCYAIDPNTQAGSDELNVEKFLEKDLSITKEGEEPQILIYHTHSQESFADSIPGDIHTSVMGVGEYLTQILTERYGYKVLHYTGQYDVESRDDAYSKALPDIERVLAENPSLQVVIDLHRDEMPEDTRLVTELDGKPTAKFMFFNGLSRTLKTGNIDYLYNENLDDNLAFSFQMQLAAMEYYPGLTRKIYLKGYRYNMHLRPRNLLVELGAQNNTVEEAMNACEPLAHILDIVLSGQLRDEW